MGDPVELAVSLDRLCLPIDISEQGSNEGSIGIIASPTGGEYVKLKSATIKNFRRFTNLTVDSIPTSTRLIMLAGPNGCGKSSFFDALHVWHSWKSNKDRRWEPDYHAKAGSPNRQQFSDDVTLEFHDRSAGSDHKKTLYVRSAYRNDPEFSMTNLRRTGRQIDETRIHRMIDNDAAVSKNYQRLASQGLEDLYERGDTSMTFAEYRHESIGNIAKSFRDLFPSMVLHSLGNPVDNGTFRFSKGDSHGFAFKNLSGGEKAAFDLILDLAVATREYDDTIFCIDEPESHMNARLQADLLSVLYDLVPRHCQLILATHSIGMMRRARDIEGKDPGSVVFLDFEMDSNGSERDFDRPQNIKPSRPDRRFWERAYAVALDDLAALVAPSRVVICEGEPIAAGARVRNHSHDAQCYNRIFESEFPDTRFVSMGSDQQIVGDKRGLAEALRLLIEGLEVVRLVDRDDRSTDEAADLIKSGVHVLSRRNLESYLFDDEVLKLLAQQGEGDGMQELLAEKERILKARANTCADDLKPSSGQIYVACKVKLGLTRCGNTAQAFMRDTLAPLVPQATNVYVELRRDIFGDERPQGGGQG